MVQKKESDVNLVFYSEDYAREIDSYIINQLDFTGTPKEALNLSKQDDERHPVLVFCREKLVGFFVLHGWGGAKRYTDNHYALLLRTFSIDSRYQGKGYGRQTVESLDAFVMHSFPDINEMILGVNHNNVPAQQLYLHHGFSDTGRRVIGRHGEQWVLSKVLK
ncbi:MAG: GNAT family N-acetyltransferase [Sporolactobacillus sp.]